MVPSGIVPGWRVFCLRCRVVRRRPGRAVADRPAPHWSASGPSCRRHRAAPARSRPDQAPARCWIRHRSGSPGAARWWRFSGTGFRNATTRDGAAGRVPAGV